MPTFLECIFIFSSLFGKLFGSAVTFHWPWKTNTFCYAFVKKTRKFQLSFLWKSLGKTRFHWPMWRFLCVQRVFSTYNSYQQHGRFYRTNTIILRNFWYLLPMTEEYWKLALFCAMFLAWLERVGFV